MAKRTKAALRRKPPPAIKAARTELIRRVHGIKALQALVVRHTPDRDTEVARQIAKLQVAIATANKALKKQGAEP
jgi:hypothetical protein